MKSQFLKLTFLALLSICSSKMFDKQGMNNI